ncbi:tripartite tricarboxylate transporter substrate binding protein [soil metagenome]
MDIHSRRRRLLHAGAATAAVAAMPRLASAAAWPTQPIRMIITYPPGGGADLTGRLIANKLSEILGQTVIVDNRPGGGGQIGAGVVSHAPADGYTLLFDASAYATNPSLYASLPYDPNKAFMPLGVVALFPNVLVVNADFPARSVQDLVVTARAKPNSLSYASSGNGASQHLSGVLFAQKLNLQMTHVPYRGGGPAMVDVIGGQVPMIFANIASSLGFIRSGKLRPLAITGSQRSAQLPDIPTVAETVIPGYEVYEWTALFAPNGTPPAVVETLSSALTKAMAADDVRNTVTAQGGIMGPDTPPAAQKFVQAQMSLWSKVIRDNGIRLE